MFSLNYGTDISTQLGLIIYNLSTLNFNSGFRSILPLKYTFLKFFIIKRYIKTMHFYYAEYLYSKLNNSN